MMNKDIVIFDLDGTLASINHRLHYIRSQLPRADDPEFKADWPAFYDTCEKDDPIYEVIEVMLALHSVGFLIWIVSGRSEEVIDKTLSWLHRHAIAPDKLLMRPVGNHQPDDELKAKWIIDTTIPVERVMCVFEDRSRVVDMYRKHGLRVMHVADGDY